MPFPLLAVAMLASTAATVAGSAMAAKSANKQAGANNQINAQNTFQSAVDRESQLINAMKADAESKMGSTDAYGNRTEWVPGVGWQVTPDERVARNIDAGLAEENKQLTHDARRNRTNADRASENAAKANPLYDAFIREVQQTAGTKLDPNRRFQQDLAGQVTGFNRGFDDAGEQFAAQMLRSGDASSVNKAAKFATERGKGMADIFAQSRSSARGQTQSEFDQSRSTPAQLAGGFHDIASGGPKGAPGTAGIERGGNTGLGLASNRGAQSSAILAGANGAPSAMMGPHSVSNGTANALITGGAQINSLGNGLDAAMADDGGKKLSMLQLLQAFGGG